MEIEPCFVNADTGLKPLSRTGSCAGSVAPTRGQRARRDGTAITAGWRDADGNLPAVRSRREPRFPPACVGGAVFSAALGDTVIGGDAKGGDRL
jgi:hypothetical protein